MTRLLQFEPLDTHGGKVAVVGEWRVEIARDDDADDGWHVHLYTPEPRDDVVHVGPIFELAVALRVAQAVFRVLDSEARGEAG